MTTADWQRAAAIYLPLVAAAHAGLLRPRRPRQFPAVLLATLWTLPTLVLLQVLNQQVHWWTFDPGAAANLHGLPMELLIGWTLLWGVLPQVAWPELGVLRSTAALLALDCILMPVCSPAIHLGRSWLSGEVVAAALVLLPALALAQWTRRKLHVRRRAVLQITLAGILFSFCCRNSPSL